MAYVDFDRIQDLKPSAFKLYVYFLHCTQNTQNNTLTMTLADLGWHSGLQSQERWRLPGKQHGNDCHLRAALAELIQKGLIEKNGNRGRRPNTYCIVDPVPP